MFRSDKFGCSIISPWAPWVWTPSCIYMKRRWCVCAFFTVFAPHQMRSKVISASTCGAGSESLADAFKVIQLCICILKTQMKAICLFSFVFAFAPNQSNDCLKLINFARSRNLHKTALVRHALMVEVIRNDMQSCAIEFNENRKNERREKKKLTIYRRWLVGTLQIHLRFPSSSRLCFPSWNSLALRSSSANLVSSAFADRLA